MKGNKMVFSMGLLRREGAATKSYSDRVLKFPHIWEPAHM